MSPADQTPGPNGSRRPSAPHPRGSGSPSNSKQGKNRGKGGASVSTSAGTSVPRSVPRSVQDAAAALPGAPTTVRRLGAEAIGTFALVLGGCGAAVLAAATTTSDGTAVGIGYVGVAFAFGLTVLVMAYAVGPVSGGHFNPAVSLGLAVAGRFAWRDVPRYAAAQVLGAIAAALVLFAVASGRPGFDATASGFATNGYGDRSPGGYSLLACLLVEVVLTALFLIVILGATDSRAPKGMAPTAIGLALTVIHLVSIPVTNTSVNPARSIAPALFAGGAAIGQLWLFVLAPLVGAAIAGVVYAALFGRVSDITSQQATSDA